MPPRIQFFSALRTGSGLCRPNTTYAFPVTGIAAPSSTAPRSQQKTFTSSAPSASEARKPQRRSAHDPYAIAQARARKAANLSRQSNLKIERQEALGDPVRGITTPFLRSFDTVGPPPTTTTGTSDTAATAAAAAAAAASTLSVNETTETPGHHLNHFVTQPEARASLRKSRELTKPRHFPDGDPAIHDALDDAHAAADSTAQAAVARILALDAGSGADRRRANVQRCIDVFGRHTTDAFLAPRPASAMTARNPALEPGVSYKTPRAGRDTGSSEVQIAILTAKIRALADGLQARGKHDAMNRRNLRLLVHRRQKLLKYLRRRERGGERWVYCIEKLGLTEGTWKGEISL